MSAAENSTVSQLVAQWTNPSDVLSILLIIGGDIVQTALAQTAGDSLAPVCFSFGWVAYSFSTLVRVLGDGRLLPPPDYPAKVFNLESTYVRENKNWILGRILRDNELFANQREQHAGSGLRISIYCATPRKLGFFGRETRNVRTIGVWAVISALQLSISVMPWIYDREWGVLLVTGTGIVASLLAGALPQWRLEKIPLKRNSKKLIALTSGNGSRDIMIIYGAGIALDLEELAGGESPRSDRLWQASKWFSTPLLSETGDRQHYKSGNEKRRANMLNGLPTGVWMTRVASFGLLVFWLALLIVVAGLKTHSWYLVIVGSLGMLQNAALAATARNPEMRGLPLSRVDTIITDNVMDGLMDLESTIRGSGPVLCNEYFPGALREDELDWWNGNKDDYDIKRQKEGRGVPRSQWNPRKRLGIPDIDGSGAFHLHNRMSTWDSAASAERMERANPVCASATLAPGAVEEDQITPAPRKFQSPAPMQEMLQVERPVTRNQRRDSSRSYAEVQVHSRSWT